MVKSFLPTCRSMCKTVIYFSVIGRDAKFHTELVPSSIQKLQSLIFLNGLVLSDQVKCKEQQLRIREKCVLFIVTRSCENYSPSKLFATLQNKSFYR